MRAFFALWPGQEAREALHARAVAMAARVGGRPVAIGKLHITLVFLGDIDEQARACLAEGAGRVDNENIELELNRAGAWRRAGVAWLAPGEVPDPLARLQATLVELARTCGIAPEQRAYFPHLTLARGTAAALAQERCVPIRLQFREFSLVRSDLGRGSYAIDGSWPLAREEDK